MNFNVILAFKKWMASIFNPPYQLILSEKISSHLPNKTIYVFKQYGSHDFFKVTYGEITSNDNIMRAINPIQLIDINFNETHVREESEKFKIKEELRNNTYKISNEFTEEIHSGDYICNNIDMFGNISSHDICKIAYKSGFNKGRKISIEIEENRLKGRNRKIQNSPKNLVLLRLIDKGNTD